MNGWPTGEGADHDLRPPLSPRAPISLKHFLVELNPEERTYLKQLVAAGSPKTLPRRRAQNLAALRPGVGGTGLDRRTHGGSRGRGRHDRVSGTPGPGPGGHGGGPATQAAPVQAGPAGLFDAAARTRALDAEAAGGRDGGPGGGGHDRARNRAPCAPINALKPWQKKCWCIPPQANAAFVHNMEDVLEVYRRPPDDRCPSCNAWPGSDHRRRGPSCGRSGKP